MPNDEWSWWQDLRAFERQSDQASWRDDWADRNDRGAPGPSDWGHGHSYDWNWGWSGNGDGAQTPDPVPDPLPDPTPDPVPDTAHDPTPPPSPGPAPDPTPTQEPTPDPTAGAGHDPAPVPDPTPDPAPDPAPDPVSGPDPQPEPASPSAPDPQPEPQTTPPPASSSSGATVHESFDNGGGIFTNHWGEVDFSVPGQVTVISKAGPWSDAGLMLNADHALGYGSYEFTLSHNKAEPGAYALLWPGNDVWPGAELDVVEVLGDGTAYSTIHFNNGGQDAFTSYLMPGVDPTGVHTYGLTWEPGRLTGYVDGQQMWSTTDHVPVDAAHGGLNELPAVGAQTWWNVDEQGGTDRTLTIYDFSYTAIG